MAKVGFYKRYLYIIDRLKSVPSKFQDLHKYVMKKLEDDDLGSNFEYSSRTFERDKKDIFDLFGILVQYNRRDKVYYIDEEIEDTSVSRMIEAFSIHQALKEGNQISPSIFLESRKASGTHHISSVLYAIQNNFQLSFTHTKYWIMEITQRTVNPIAIKESQHRWYLIGQDNKDSEIKKFGFDRITDLKVSDIKFKPILFDVEKNYQYAFGVETNSKAQKIILEFSRRQGNYIKSFPLHSSQKIISDSENLLTIELFMHPSFDFGMELLKYGEDVKVVEPLKLREEMKHRIVQMMRMYNLHKSNV